MLVNCSFEGAFDIILQKTSKNVFCTPSHFLIKNELTIFIKSLLNNNTVFYSIIIQQLK